MEEEIFPTGSDLGELLKLWRYRNDRLSELFQAARLEPRNREKLAELSRALQDVSEIVFVIKGRIEDALEG
tara:strand:+ start:334 stop:546 length:213 start_codon:yes stop_codon:yes gene_type:complete